MGERDAACLRGCLITRVRRWGHCSLSFFCSCGQQPLGGLASGKPLKAHRENHDFSVNDIVTIDARRKFPLCPASVMQPPHPAMKVEGPVKSATRALVTRQLSGTASSQKSSPLFPGGLFCAWRDAVPSVRGRDIGDNVPTTRALARREARPPLPGTPAHAPGIVSSVAVARRNYPRQCRRSQMRPAIHREEAPRPRLHAANARRVAPSPQMRSAIALRQSRPGQMQPAIQGHETLFRQLQPRGEKSVKCKNQFLIEMR
jgi:hypothetical protein